MFAENSIILREVCNGIMFISAVIIVGIFLHYVWTATNNDRNWYKNPVTQSAGAIILLMTGHAMRAFSGWMQFLWMDIGWDPSLWSNSVDLFIVATTLIIGAKVLMIFIFSPIRWRTFLTNTALLLSIGIPAAIALAVAEHGKSLDLEHPQVTEAELVSPPNNGRMTIKYRASDPSKCPIEVDVAISRAEDDAVVWRHRGDATRVSTEWLADVSIPKLPSGRYLYYATFRAKCSETRVYTSKVKPVPFEL